jgi:PAS domain S-box-containing protein
MGGVNHNRQGLTEPAALAELLRRRARWLAAGTAFIAAIVLAGWITDIAALKSIRPDWPPMVPNTALGMLLSAGALCLLTLRPAWHWLARILGAGLVVGSGLLLAEFLFNFDFGLRYWIFHDQLLRHEVDRVAFGTALNFLLVGVVILLPWNRRWHGLGEVLLHFIGLMALLRFIGYPFGIAIFQSLGGFKTMAIPTSLAFILLWLGLAHARGPYGALRVLLSPHIGGRLARLLLPAVVIVPLAISWLRLQGERAGLFSSAEGTALVATSMFICFSLLVLTAGHILNRADARREAQAAALRRSELRLKRLFESPMMGVFTWSRDGWVTDANDQFLRLLGFAREDITSGWMSWSKEMPDHNRNLLVTGEGVVPAYETELSRADGRTLPVMLGAVYPDDELEEGIGFILDNSERRQTQEQIEERNAELEQLNSELDRSQARLKRLFESPMLGVFYWDLNGRILDANRHFLDMTGYTPAELSAGNLKWSEMTPPEYDAIEAEKIKEIMATGAHLPYENEFIRADGTRLPVVVGAALLDKEAREGVAFVLDNSDRKHARELLEERQTALEAMNDELEQLNAELAGNEERLQRVIDSPLIGITFWRLVDGLPVMTDANNQFLDMLGYTRADLAAGRLTWQSVSTPEEDEQLRVRNNAQFAETGRIAPYEREYICADGSRLPVMVGAVLIDAETQSGVSFVLDIREQRRQRETIEERNAELEQLSGELAHNEKRLRAVFESPLVGLFFWYLDGRIYEANPRFYELTGYSAEDVAAGRVSYDLLAGAANDAATQARRRAVSERGWLNSTEVVITRADGGRVPIVISSMLLDREARQGVSLFLDITEQYGYREQIEERNAELEQLYDELAGSENRLRRVFDSPLLGMVMWRLDGGILNANRRFFDMLGYKPSDIGNGRLTWSAILPPEDSEEAAAQRSQELLVQGETVPREREFIRSDGSHIPVLYGSALFDTQAKEGVTYIMDITEQRRARELIEERRAELEELNAELARSTARTRAVFESPLSAMAFSRVDGTITEVNTRFLELTGVEQQRVDSGTLTWLDLTPPELRQRSSEQSGRIRQQGVIVPEEDVLYRADGSRLPVLAGGALLPGAGDEWIAFLLDRSEQARQRETIEERNAELEQLNAELEARTDEVERLASDLQSRNVLLEQLREAAQQANVQLSLNNADLSGQNNRLAELEREAREAAAQLESRATELQRINAELDSFSYSVSHDLRAPLRAIEGFSKALEEDYADQLDADAQRYIARIRAGTVRMAQLIDDLLQLSRVSRAELNIGRLDISELAQVVAAQLADSDPSRNVEWTIAPGLVTQADGRLLRIVLENLMGNAFKFTAKRDPARIAFTQVETEQGPAFSVSDNGAGFDMAYASKLFTAFQRLHTVEEFPGTGIGLSIVRRIISRHDGEIWAESRPEEGTTFYFTLPKEQSDG